MICPQTKAECKAKYCQRRNVCWDEKFPTPPKPTLDEFERLATELERCTSAVAVARMMGSINAASYEQERDAARAALIDYVRRMGVE